MSRPLKFRAWDDTKKEWTFNIKVNINITESVGSRTGNIWMKSARKFHKVVIEQYTGLKDMHGKEIYEGDIVFDKRCRIYTGLPSDNHTYIVKWEERIATFVLYHTGKYSNSFVMFKDYKDLEVIGNVHENPELLGGEE